MTKVEINGKLEFIENPEQFANQIEQYMGKDARAYFESITINNIISIDDISDIIYDLENASCVLENIKETLKENT
jgi:hypothetical protein